MSAAARSGAISRRTAAEAVTDALRADILAGRQPEGAALREAALAEAFGVSRVPVREALRRLEAEGLVVLAPHKGASVAALSADELRELLELRLRLEGWLLALAIPKLRPAALEAATALAAEMTVADLEAWGALNWRLHAALLEPAGRPVALRLLEGVHRGADRYLRLHVVLTDGRRAAEAEHRALIERCRVGDTAGALALLERHVGAAGEAVIARLEASRSAADGLRDVG